jgi:Na+/proline symporter
MPLTWTDWIVIGGYLLINLAIGIYYRRRSGGNTEEFFVSGRNVSWWLAGTSMVATTFAADTPLFVSGVIATQGIAGNWIWWTSCLGGMLTVFFFARYWRRAEVLTDVELTEIRYGGKPAAFLRGFKAIYLGLAMNCLILGWVTNAMVSIIAVLLGPLIAQGKVLQLTLGGHTLLHYTLGAPSHTALLICIFVLIPFTGIYTSIGGLWGVLVTDLFQFALKMTMVVVLAWVAVAKIGGMQALKLQLQFIGQQVQKTGAQTSNPLAFFPDFHLGWTSSAIWTLPVLTFLMYLGVQWWSAWYPGAEPGGGGYVAQRMFCARHCALCGASVAMDHYRIGRAGGLLSTRRLAAGRCLWRESPAGLRDGSARFSSSGIARRNGSGVSCRIHVNAGNAIELGRLLPGKRLVPAFYGAAKN